MKNIFSFKNKLFQTNDKNFEKFALELFHYQAENNSVYKNYLQYLDLKHQRVNTIKEIPFLPVDFFKNKKILTTIKEHEQVFESSGTTGSKNSRHYIHDLELYNESITRAFSEQYGSPEKYIFFCLLPHYLERKNSSLVHMARQLIMASKNQDGGFFLYDYELLVRKVKNFLNADRKVFILGVSYALLDLAEQFSLNLNDAVVMETGGMKGRKNEMAREELHSSLKEAFQISKVHSEYGMTELLSQAYSTGDGIYKFPSWASLMIRDIYDPFDIKDSGRGQVLIMDLANIYSVAFIETKDIAYLYDDGSFEILGRLDNSDLRGCNLLL